MAREGITSTRGHHKRTRMFVGGRPRPDNKKHKQAEAKERLEAWTKLSPKEQLKALDGRPGGSTKQRARILARTDNPRTKKVTEDKGVTVTVTEGETTSRVKAKDRKAQERTKRPGASSRGA